jgi:hypothetical protein
MRFPSRRTFWVSAATLLLVIVACAWFLMPRSKINHANFDKISDGMTEEEVTAILGEPEHKARVFIRIEGAANVMFWSSGRDRISIVFVKGKVLEKHFNLAMTVWENLKWRARQVAAKIGWQ